MSAQERRLAREYGEVETDADRRFRRLAAAIAHDAARDDVPDLELDVRGRIFSYQERGDDGQAKTRHVAVLEHRLDVTEGIGERASEAWGEQLSDEEGWFRFALVSWEESVATTEDIGSGWWTFGAGRGVVPVPPWEARDYSPPPRKPVLRHGRLRAYAPGSDTWYIPPGSGSGSGSGTESEGAPGGT